MIRSIASISVGIALTIAAASVADAQAALPSSTSVPGTGDASKMSAANREANADYNRVVGSGAKSSADGETRRAPKSSPVAATAADITVGLALRDVKGVRIGTISQVDPDGVVVDTGATKIKVPASAFGKDGDGLLLSVTAAKFNELIAKAHAAH